MSFLKARYYPYGSRIHGTKISRNSPIVKITEPEEVKISMSQHIGAPAIPAVSVGDKVKKGTLIYFAIYCAIVGILTIIL